MKVMIDWVHGLFAYTCCLLIADSFLETEPFPTTSARARWSTPCNIALVGPSSPPIPSLDSLLLTSSAFSAASFASMPFRSSLLSSLRFFLSNCVPTPSKPVAQMDRGKSRSFESQQRNNYFSGIGVVSLLQHSSYEVRRRKQISLLGAQNVPSPAHDVPDKWPPVYLLRFVFSQGRATHLSIYRRPPTFTAVRMDSRDVPASFFTASDLLSINPSTSFVASISAGLGIPDDEALLYRCA